jgi:hypothetical protein
MIIAHSHFLGLEGEWQFADRKETIVQHMVLQSRHCTFLHTMCQPVICVVICYILCHESSAWIYRSSGMLLHSAISQETLNLYQHSCDNHKSHSFYLHRAEIYNLKDPILNLLGIQRTVDERPEVTIIK